VRLPTDPPSGTTPRGRDDRFEIGDLRLVAAKRQVAILRTLADELERCLARSHVAPSIYEHLVVELRRLGRKSLDAAAALSASAAGAKVEAEEEKSGVHALGTFATR
jgi:hypothetical protein